jgi:hypothetical protein
MRKDLSGSATCQTVHRQALDRGVSYGWMLDFAHLCNIWQKYFHVDMRTQPLPVWLGDNWCQSNPNPGPLQRLCVAANIEIPEAAEFCLFHSGPAYQRTKIDWDRHVPNATDDWYLCCGAWKEVAREQDVMMAISLRLQCDWIYLQLQVLLMPEEISPSLSSTLLPEPNVLPQQVTVLRVQGFRGEDDWTRSLPDDILVHCFCWLDFRTLLRAVMGQVCARWHKLYRSQVVKRYLVRSLFQPPTIFSWW